MISSQSAEGRRKTVDKWIKKIKQRGNEKSSPQRKIAKQSEWA